MPAELIDGKAIAEELRARIGAGVADLQSTHNLTPGLAVVLVGVGARPASDAGAVVRRLICLLRPLLQRGQPLR